MKTLKTLEEHNKNKELSESIKREEEERKKVEGIPNGIACPTCGNELVDAYPFQGFSNESGSIAVIYCKNCQYKGSRRI